MVLHRKETEAPHKSKVGYQKVILCLIVTIIGNDDRGKSPFFTILLAVLM
ncbi:hypothetical protein AB3M96_17365 [Fredinandcohnia sp. 179-A 10B2 NHS]